MHEVLFCLYQFLSIGNETAGERESSGEGLSMLLSTDGKLHDDDDKAYQLSINVAVKCEVVA